MLILRKPKDGRGFTLVELLIAVGIAGILLIASASFFGNSIKSISRVSNEIKLEDLRHELRVMTDCPKTRESLPDPCPLGTKVAIISKAGHPIIDPTEATSRGVRVTAKCSADPDSYNIAVYKNKAWRKLFTLPFQC
jgi:prepilin-type N-terminal cleavage/methylation domain-containing protein